MKRKRNHKQRNFNTFLLKILLLVHFKPENTKKKKKHTQSCVARMPTNNAYNKNV